MDDIGPPNADQFSNFGAMTTTSDSMPASANAIVVTYVDAKYLAVAVLAILILWMPCPLDFFQTKRIYVGGLQQITIMQYMWIWLPTYGSMFVGFVNFWLCDGKHESAFYHVVAGFASLLCAQKLWHMCYFFTERDKGDMLPFIRAAAFTASLMLGSCVWVMIEIAANLRIDGFHATIAVSFWSYFLLWCILVAMHTTRTWIQYDASERKKLYERNERDAEAVA